MKKNKDTIKQIKILKQVQPDESFVRGTRSLILSTKPNIHLVPKWIVGLVLTSLFFFVITSGIILSNKQPQLSSSSLNQTFLSKEFNEMDLNIQIKEITYSQDVHETIASALNAISSSKTNHMNSSIIESENNYINYLQNIKEEEEINKLLNQVID